MIEPENLEHKVMLSLLNYTKAEGNFLEEFSSQIIKKKENIFFSLEDLYSLQFPISKDLFENWIQINNKPISFLTLKESFNIKICSSGEFDSLFHKDENRWSVFYSISRPGFSENGDYALIQITAHCPAGPPNYGSLYLLEKNDSIWIVNYSYGIYNQ